MPETFLNSMGSWPTRMGLFEISSELKKLKNRYDTSLPWKSAPISMPGEVLRGQNQQGIADAIGQSIGESISKINSNEGKYFREAPFLWSKVNAPIGGESVQDWVSRQVKLGVQPNQAVNFAESFLARHGMELGPNAKMPRLDLSSGALPAFLEHELKDFPSDVPLPKTVRVRQRVPFLYGNAYNPAAGELRLSDISPKQVFHEFGHARDLGRKWRRNTVLGSNALGKALMYTVPASILMGDKVSDTLPGSIDDKIISTLQKYGPEAWLASKAISDLHPELVATRHAGSKLKSLADIAPEFGGDFLKRQLKANRLGMLGRVPRVALPYGLMALARMAMKNKLKDGGKPEQLEKESAIPLPAGLELLMRAGRTYLGRGAPVISNIKHVFSPFERPTLKNVKQMMSNPLLMDSVIGAGAPVGAAALTLAAIEARKEQAEQSGLPESAGLAKTPFLNALAKATKKTGEGAVKILGTESFGELLS
jgi:hypothetical protein